MTIKIIFLGYWATPQQLLDQYFKNDTPEHDGKWNNLEAVTNINDADYYVVFDCGHPAHPIQRLDPLKVIYIQLEPPGCQTGLMKRTKLPLNAFFFSGTHDKTHIPAFTNYIAKPYKTLKSTPYTPRQKKIVAICSGKRITPQHVKRIHFLEFLSSKGLPIDIYGKGLNGRTLNGCYKGEWKPKSKFELLNQYQYCIVLENYICANHMTEKLYDCFLSLTFPIYNGCTNIEKYFDKDTYCAIDISNREASYLAIKDLLFHHDIPVEKLKRSRDAVLDKYTIWPTVEKIVKP